MVVHQHHPRAVSTVAVDEDIAQEESKNKHADAHKVEVQDDESSWHAALRKLRENSVNNAELRYRVV
jgi:hypothetical protein